MEPVDTLHTFETPEGVSLSLRLAGPLPRILAFVVDSLVRAAILVGAGMVFGMFGKLGTGGLLLLLFTIEWLYPVLFEVSRGWTPGKRAMGLQVVHDNGTPVGWQASMVRNLLRVVDLLPVGYATGLVTMLCNRRFQRLGDLAAGTLVVYRERPGGGDRIPDAPALPIPVPLSVTEQRAIIDFAARSTTLAPGRVEELAALIGRDPQTVIGYANFLAKGR